MVHRFETTAEVAHALTKLKKHHGFYFRALTKTTSTPVVCEVTEKGFEFIKAYNII